MFRKRRVVASWSLPREPMPESGRVSDVEIVSRRVGARAPPRR
ncbi:hypothetical protein [Lysobacter gummosus]